MFQFAVIHMVKGFHVVKKAEVDVFLKFPCFLYDLTNVGNLISGSSAFSKPSLGFFVSIGAQFQVIWEKENSLAILITGLATSHLLLPVCRLR